MRSKEPPCEDYPYAGWVPTANGHLSFRHIGETRHPTESVYANVTADRRRLVLGYQRRPLSDVLFQTLIHYLCGINGEFWFVVAATSEGIPGDVEELTGVVYIYKSKTDWKTCQRVARIAIDQLNDNRLSMRADRDVLLQRCFSECKSTMNNTADITIDFWLNRSGEIFFGKPTFQDSDLGYASRDYAEKLGHNFALWMANQTYFFIRDISHGHQHHVPTADTIIILQERVAGDRVTWRRNIIYSLHHYIIRAKRGADAGSLSQAAGILSYCMSFQAICRRHLGSDAEHIPNYNDDALLGSLNARSAEHAVVDRATESANRKAADRKSWALLFATILIALLAWVAKAEDVSLGRLGKLTEIATSNAEAILVAVVIYLLLIWIFNPTHSRAKWSIVRDTLELSNVRRVTAMILYLIIGTIVLAAAVAIAWPAALNLFTTVISLFKTLVWP